MESRSSKLAAKVVAELCILILIGIDRGPKQIILTCMEHTGEALPKDELELIGLTLGGFKPSIVLVTNQVVVRDLEV